MNNYMEIKNIKITLNMGVTNKIEYARNTKNKGFLFEYFKECNKANIEWGSNKPIKGEDIDKIQMIGENCNNIWNNSTKRKIIVK